MGSIKTILLDMFYINMLIYDHWLCTTISFHRIKPDNNESDRHRSDTVSVTCMFDNKKKTLFLL